MPRRATTGPSGTPEETPSRPLRGNPNLNEDNLMHRSTVNKRHSARSFNKKAKRTHPKNLHVMRGGYRL